MKNRISILSFLLLFCTFTVFAEANGKMTLILLECQKYIPDVWCQPNTKETAAYHFENGMLKNREVLMTGDQNPFEFRFSPLTQYIYQNRYLISDGGDVYDYDARKILYRNIGGGILTYYKDVTIQNLGVVKPIGERLYVRLAVSDANATNREGFYVFNLQTNQFNKIRDIGDFPQLITKNFSPDNKKIAVIEKMKLIFYAVDEKFHFKKLRRVELGYPAPADKYEDSSEDVPIEWVNNESVVTQNKAGSIVKAEVNGRISPILKLKKIDADGKPLTISKDRFGNFLVSPCNDRDACLLDLKMRKLKQIECDPLGNGFSAMPEKRMSNNEFWQSDFYFKGNSIGKNRQCYNALSNSNYLAVENKDKWGKIAEVKVWNTVSKDWTVIKINWHNNGFIVDWIEGK